MILGYWIRFIWIALQLDLLIRKLSKTEKFSRPLPRVSIVVPARNEADHIDQCLSALQNQDYPNLEILLVNDRSTDRTGEVMKKYAEITKDWKYIEIKSLPDGWLGKNHALEQGGQQATGEYIIFTDGDVVYQPNTITKTMQSVITHNLDHLVLSANLKAKDPLLIAMQALFTTGMVSLLKLHQLGKSPNRYIGAGVYNLVKTSLYRSIGGHQSIRLEVIDDLMLGKIMVQAGGKPGFMDGRDLISVEWYSNWKQMILGLEKNGFASVRYSLPRLLAFMSVTYGIYLFPYFGIFLFYSPLNYIFAASLLISHAVMAEVSRRTGHAIWVTFLLPIAAVLIGFAFLRSALIAIRKGSITWRETSYSLKTLKENTKL